MSMHTRTLLATVLGIASLTLSAGASADDRDQRRTPPGQNWAQHYDRHDDWRNDWRNDRRNDWREDRRWDAVRDRSYYYGVPVYYENRIYHIPPHYRYSAEPSVIINLPSIIFR